MYLALERCRFAKGGFGDSGGPTGKESKLCVLRCLSCCFFVTVVVEWEERDEAFSKLEETGAEAVEDTWATPSSMFGLYSEGKSHSGSLLPSSWQEYNHSEETT